MRPYFESVGSFENASFMVRKFSEKSFSAPYHFHPELELTLILNGSGKRYVGSHMHDYSAGDLVLLGANLPHCWKTEETNENSISVVVHFTIDFLGKDFFYKREMNAILQLLHNSNYGVKFTDDTIVKESMLCLLNEFDSFKKLIIFLKILHQLAANDTFTILDKQSFYPALSRNDKQRINDVTAYVVENFQHAVSLQQAASIANMTLHAFCKYFKKVTRRTFMEAVNDYRIDFAMRQLINTTKPVAEISFDSGFNDVSNFHKIFKKKLALSPLKYRNTFKKIE